MQIYVKRGIKKTPRNITQTIIKPTLRRLFDFILPRMLLWALQLFVGLQQRLMCSKRVQMLSTGCKP